MFPGPSNLASNESTASTRRSSAKDPDRTGVRSVGSPHHHGYREGLLRSLGTHSQPVEARSGKDQGFHRHPRPNMYQSLHASVIGPHGQPFEIQIRTMEMHRVAEEGIAAHWKYKTGKPSDNKDDQRFLWLRHLGGMAAGDAGPKRLSEYAENRSLSRRGLCVYSERQGYHLTARRLASRLCLRNSYRGRQ